MNSLLMNVFAVLLLFAGSTSFADNVDDGGMSGGGGGGVFPGAPVTETQVAEVLRQARLEVHMALAYQSQGITFPWPELFQEPKTVFNFIRDYEIFANSDDCYDSHGAPTDGSIYSPLAGTICISVGRLAKKLTTDNVRAQVLALVIHEYSHLKGFDEAKAAALQKWFTPLFANSSSEQAFNLLDFIMRQSLDLADYIHYFKTKPMWDMNWDYLCFVSEKMENALTIIEQKFIDKPFSVFHRELYTKQNSFLVKQIVIKTQVCARSQYHPEKFFFEQHSRTWFKDTDQILDGDIATDLLRSTNYDVRENILVLGDLPIRRISTFPDSRPEFSDMESYINGDLRFYINQMWSLTSPTRRD